MNRGAIASKAPTSRAWRSGSGAPVPRRLDGVRVLRGGHWTGWLGREDKVTIAEWPIAKKKPTDTFSCIELARHIVDGRDVIRF